MTPAPNRVLPAAVRAMPLEDGWRLARTVPGAASEPADLDRVAVAWHDARVPGTVGMALHRDLDVPGPYDADDWWYRTRFARPPGPAGARFYLRFDGLATLAEVWLNGAPLMESRNMFVGTRVEVTAALREANELVIRFASLEAALAGKQPRPRWRTALVSAQNLRAFRTTLLGRMPGWSVPVAPVGPWGPVVLECVERCDVRELELHAFVDGAQPRIALRAQIATVGGAPIDNALLRVGEDAYALDVEPGRDGCTVCADLAIREAPLWWPHTHGEPNLVPCRLEVQAGGEWIGVDCGRVGFRALALDTDDGLVDLYVNDVPVFCRGACWTPLDPLALHAPAEALRAALETARAAGVNMLRIGGTMVYESDAFYRLCDELGILVWQDFMFANMDYPLDDADFRCDAEAEARWQLRRLHRHPCIAMYCGGSETAQQAAMMGVPAGQWLHPFFSETLPGLAAQLHPGVPYFPATPWGGPLPFHVGTGLAHYYGVGAYRRPLADVKSARVKFAAECLAFANVPDPDTMQQVLGTPIPPPHHPKWKARQPRDPGAGWDFEDVRDHYLEALFGKDPVALRSRDLARYYALSRVVSGEVMRRVFAEWRAPQSGCGGGLVWFHRDLVPGAGWGIVDATGRPKAAYWYLKRAWAPRSVHFTDEGLDGLAIHVVNDGAEPLDATVELELLQAGKRAADIACRAVAVAPHEALTLSADGMLGFFTDSTAAYRFGPPKHDVIAVRLRSNVDGEVLGEDFHFPAGLDLQMQADARVEAQVAWREANEAVLTLRSDTFLQSVAITCAGFTPDDNYFHVAPQQPKRVVFRGRAANGRFSADLEPLNLARVVAVRAQRQTEERTA